MHPRALAHPSTPPPWSQNPRKRPRTRKQYPPAPAPIVTPSITSPPGYPRLLASARREPIEPAQWPPSPTIRGDAGFSLDARRGRDRNNLVISTTEQHAALPYQGRAERRPAAPARRRRSPRRDREAPGGAALRETRELAERLDASSLSRHPLRTEVERKCHACDRTE